MKLSVITVNYNNAAGLQQTMASVLAQLPAAAEYLIVDGGSTDDSPALIRAQASRLAYWVSEKDLGVYDAMNKGCQKASGNYLMFLNSGDLLAQPNSLQACLDLLEAHPTTDVLYGDVATVINGQPVDIWRFPAQLNLTFFRTQTINHQASLIKASLFKELGPYPAQYPLAADYWLYLACMLQDKTFTHFNAQLICYDKSGLSAADSYQHYVAEMRNIWQALVPPYVQALVEEILQLRTITEARVVKLAAAGNTILRRLFKR
jgi:glycosyltransferase involved in cell wall biosynthesis